MYYVQCLKEGGKGERERGEGEGEGGKGGGGGGGGGRERGEEGRVEGMGLNCE